MNSHWSIKFFRSEFHLFEFHKKFFEFLKCFQYLIILNFWRKSFDLFLFDNFHFLFLNQMSASWISKKLFETKKKKLKTNILKKRFSFMLTKILKNSKIIESSIFVYKKQFIMILICLINQYKNYFKKINKNWFKTYVVFKNFDWIIWRSKKFVKLSCIKRLNKIIFTNKRWIKSIEWKMKIIHFFLQSSNEKSNCCKNHRILFRQLQLQIKNQSFSKKIKWIIEYENENVDEIIQFFNQFIIDFETYNMKSDWFKNTESND